MQNVLRMLWQGIGFGFLAGFVWWWANAFARVKGVGLLERQFWPLSDQWACVAIAVIFGAVGELVYQLLKNKKTAGLKEESARLGLDFQEDIERSEFGLSAEMAAFDDWYEGKNVMRGSCRGLDMTMFDLTRCVVSRGTDNSSSTSYPKRTMIVLKLDQPWDSFQLVNSRGVGLLLQLFGFEGVRFQVDETLISEEELLLIAKFKKQFVVMQGMDTERPTEESTAEFCDAMTERISLDLVRRLMSGRGWSVECCGSHVAFYTGKVFSISQRARVLDEVGELFDELSTGDRERGGMRLIATGAGAPTEMNFSFGQMMWPFGCAAASMFGALTIFGVVFFVLIEAPGWIVFLWPFFGMGMAVLGGFVGLRIRNALAARGS